MADEGVRLLTVEEIAGWKVAQWSSAEPHLQEPAFLDRVIATLEQYRAEFLCYVEETYQQKQRLEELEADEDRAGLLARVKALEEELDRSETERIAALEERDEWKAAADEWARAAEEEGS